MAAVSVPKPTGRSLLGKLAVSLEARARAKRGTSRLAVFVVDHVGTAAALAAGDTGMFHIGPAQGWIGLAVAIVIAEFKVRG